MLLQHLLNSRTPAAAPKSIQRASETQKNINKLNQTSIVKSPRTRVLGDELALRNGGLSNMKSRIEGIIEFLRSDPTRQPSARVAKFLNNAIAQYEKSVKASIGMPTYSDSVVTQVSGPRDIPTVPLSGFQLIERLCYVPKLASSGSTAGGFFANLLASDLTPFVNPSSGKYFRVKKVTSWTVPRQDGNINQGNFAGVSVPASTGTQGTEVMPIWSENYTPPGQGFSSIETRYPLGDFPQVSAEGADVTILSHFTSLGNSGGVTNVPVIFHVTIECLV